MGKPTGFLEYDRKEDAASAPLERMKHFNEFHVPMSEKSRKEQAARCMDCGVPFCQSGMMLHGMASGCPLNNLVPEWNDCRCFARQIIFQSLPQESARLCVKPLVPVG